MRIGLLTGSFLPQVGGMEWKVHYLAAEYKSRGHDVTVFAPEMRASLQGAVMPVKPEYALIRAGREARGFGALGITGFLMRRAISRAHLARPFDILHCHHLGNPTSWGAQVRRRFNIPVVATTCGDDVFRIPELNYGVRINPRQDRLIRRNIRSIDVIGCISRSVREELVSLGATATLVNIPNGAPWEEFQMGPSRLIREKLNLSDDDLVVLSVGRNLNAKRYDLGIQAFAQMARRMPNVHYAIIGRDLDSLVRPIHELGMEQRIHLIGEVHISQVAHAMRSADVFFNPSMQEGFAQVNAQALACGLPLVITDAPGNVDAADHGGAVVARFNDVRSMSEKLMDVLGDAELRRRLAAEAGKAGRHYAWSRIAEQYLDIFSGLIRRAA